VSDVLEVAKTGRAKCRGCGRNIAGGELRFGESLPNPYAEGDTQYWFHLTCAACMRPDKLGPALERSGAEIPERDWLRQTAEVGMTYERLPRLARAERATVGRAHCRLCHELIHKGSWRLALQVFEDGRMNHIGTIHVECAEAYLGTADILDRILRLTDGLNQSDLSELQSLLAHQRPAPKAKESLGLAAGRSSGS
jgi:hypothetical protein